MNHKLIFNYLGYTFARFCFAGIYPTDIENVIKFIMIKTYAMQLIIKMFRTINTQSILTISKLPRADYCANPYIGCTHACKYCYASYMTRFTNHSEPWGSFVDIKYWDAIKKPQKYYGKNIFIGSVTDAYQPCETKYKRTRILLEQLSGYGPKITICTKSDLVLRDLDLIKIFPNALVAFSINTLDDNFRRDMDNAVSIERRLNAMKVFYDEGIQTACFISPIFPKITDVKAIIAKARDKCNFIWLENLNLRGNFKYRILEYIYNNYHKLYSLYCNIYINNDLLYWQSLDSELREFAKTDGYKYVYVYADFFINPKHYSSDMLPTIVNWFYHADHVKSNALSSTTL